MVMSLTSILGRSGKKEDVTYSAVETDQPDSAQASQTSQEAQQAATIEPSLVDKLSRPRPLRGVSIPLFIGDCLLVMLPVAFLVLGIAAYKLDQKPISEYGKTVQRAMTLGPTIYPLLFAALCGRCLRSLAVWYAECGTTIEVLEKLLGSQNVVSAISTASAFRSANALSLLLLLLWALSPLGGQSSLRLLHETNRTISETSQLYYSAPDVSFALHNVRPWYSVVPSILSASLAASAAIKNGPVDLWSHPKVPRLEAVENENDPGVGKQGVWHNVNDTSSLTYSSWTGVNVIGLRKNRKASFQTRYNYMVMDCKSRLRGGFDHVKQGLSAPNVTALPALKGNPSVLQETMDFQDKQINVTTSFFLKYGFNGTKFPDYNSQPYRNGMAFSEFPAHILYGSMDDIYLPDGNENTTLNVYECLPRMVTVEAGIFCNSDMCKINKLRRLPNAPGNTETNRCTAEGKNTILCLTALTITLDTFIVLFPTVTSFYTKLGEPNPFDHYIHSGTDIYNATTSSRARNWTAVSEQRISERLTVLLNTYWQAGSWGSQILATEPFTQPAGTGQIGMTNATAQIWHEIPVYSANLPWILTLLFTTTVLLILGDIHLIMSWAAIAPDIFNCVSSLTKESPYVKVPSKGTALDGVERSRLLRTLKVQLTDVRADEDVGYIALRSVEAKEEFAAVRLMKGRLYA